MNGTIFIAIFALVLINYAATKPIIEAENHESSDVNEIRTTIEVTEKPSVPLISFLVLLNPISKTLKNDESYGSKIPEKRLQRTERQAKLINETGKLLNEEGDAPFVSILRQIMAIPNVLEKPDLMDESEAPFVSTLLMKIIPKINNVTNLDEMMEFVSTLYNATKNRVFNATEKTVSESTERIDNNSEKTVDISTERIDSNSAIAEDNSTSLSLGIDDKIIAEVTTQNVNRDMVEKMKKDEKLLREFEDSIKFLTQNFGGIFPPQQFRNNTNLVNVIGLSGKTNLPEEGFANKDSSIIDENNGTFEESYEFFRNCNEDFPYPSATNQEPVNAMIKRSEGSSLDNENDENIDDLVILDKRIEGNLLGNETKEQELQLSKDLMEIFQEVDKIMSNIMNDDGTMKVKDTNKNEDYIVNDLLGFDMKLKDDENTDDDEIIVNNFGNVLFLDGKEVAAQNLDEEIETNIILDGRNKVDINKSYDETNADEKLLIVDEENEGYEVLELEHRRIFELVRDLLDKLI